MKYITMILTLFLIFAASPIYSQEDVECDPTELAAQYGALISEAETLDELDRLQSELKNTIDICQNENEREGEVATAEGTRTDPIPLGQYFQFNKGKFRIVDVVDPYTQLQYSQLKDGHRIIAIEIEYVCESQDPNVSCEGRDMRPNAIVTEDGVVLESSDTSVSTAEGSYIGKEVFSGNTITGFIYRQVPEDVQIESIRHQDLFIEIYFSLVGN